ncbi:Spore coat protein SA [compost metagenome]
MKIAITADPEIAVPPLYYGGIERIIDMLIHELTRLGHDITLFANKESSVPCQLKPYLTSGNGIRDIAKNSWLITKNCVQHKYDIVHSFGRLAYLLPILPLKIPKLMSYQREPTLLQIKRANLLAAKNSLRFTGCSHYISNQIRPFAISDTVYNGVNFEKYKFSEIIESDAPLTFLGRIEPNKGAHTAIEIALKANKRLVIAGNVSKEHENYFAAAIKPFLGDQISYIGPVNDEQKSDLLSNSAAFLMPIHWNEPFGIVMVEAMACGTPVFGLSRGAVPEVVENGITGYHTQNLPELIDFISKPHHISRRNVYERAKLRFSAEEITSCYLNIYQKY